MNQQAADWRTCLGALRVGQFVMVMGWSGLYFCVDKLEQLLGLGSQTSLIIAGIDGALFLGLCLGMAMRLFLTPKSLVKELTDPLGLSASAALAVAMVLLSRVLLSVASANLIAQMDWGVGVGSLGEGLKSLSVWVWYAGSGLELILSLAVTVVYLNLWRQNKPLLSLISPVMFIPAAGNILAALAGVPLGHVTWSVLQFALGLLLWPLVSCLLVLRVRNLGPLPKMARPSWFIALSPPSVAGLSLLVFQAPAYWVWACWLLALLMLLGLLPILNEARKTKFSNAHWAFSFPLAAWCSLSISLASNVPVLLGVNGGPVMVSGLGGLTLSPAQIALGLLTLGIGVLLVWLSLQSILRGLFALRASLDQV
jgi:tellurite resistance protein